MHEEEEVANIVDSIPLEDIIKTNDDVEHFKCCEAVHPVVPYKTVKIQK